MFSASHKVFKRNSHGSRCAEENTWVLVVLILGKVQMMMILVINYKFFYYSEQHLSWLKY
jgi:hypothetical protein